MLLDLIMRYNTPVFTLNVYDSPKGTPITGRMIRKAKYRQAWKLESLEKFPVLDDGKMVVTEHRLQHVSGFVFMETIQFYDGKFHFEKLKEYLYEPLNNTLLSLKYSDLSQSESMLA